MKQMTDILDIDATKKEGRKILLKTLRKIPFFKNDEDINIDTLEKAIWKMENKTGIITGYILFNRTDRYYSAMCKDKKEECVKTVYGKKIVELYIKILILQYDCFKKRGKK